MASMLQGFIDICSKQPKKTFLYDGLGALLSAFMLCTVLVYFQEYVGIPKQTLYLLAFFPILFALYDLICYLRLEKDYSVFIYALAAMNFLYCILSIVLAVFHRETITTLGWTYIVLELSVLFVLTYAEVAIGQKNKETLETRP